ncbi:Transcription-repair-coupling factor [bioreactor metagenome]|uniref:Transcription-repair-coupling factor n=1 Tax=bioreactor metagenome TaxID=1076179 RepID=A0A645ITQ0_9ZZZZ
MQDEISERFGKLPETVENLFAIGGIKYLAQKVSVASITQEANRVLISFREGHPLTGEILLRIAAVFGNKISFENNKKFSIKLCCNNMSPGEMLEFINKVLHQLITLL